MSSRRVSSDKDKKRRTLISFFLFVSFAVFSMSACFTGVILNKNTFDKMFTDSVYVSEIRKDVVAYTEDLCDKVSLPKDFVEPVLRYNTIAEINNAYIDNVLVDTETYTDYAYEVLTEQLEVDIADNVSKTIKDKGIKVDKNQAKSGVEQFAKDVTEYLKGRIEFKYMDELLVAVDTGRMICSILCALSFVSCFILIVMLFKSNGKKYRKLRNISISLASASLFDAVMYISVLLVKLTKDLVIYPGYLADLFIRYVDQCVLCVCGASFALMVVSLMIISIIWKLKRREKE